MRRILYIEAVLACLFSACTVQLPTDYKTTTTLVAVSPDYKEVTIPPNIAPLNFRILNAGDEYVTLLSGSMGGEMLVAGSDVQMNVKEWHRLLDRNKGDKLTVQTYIFDEGTWIQYPAFEMSVGEEPIDGYLCYRNIAPSYVHYEDLYIRQRDLTCFDEDEVYATSLVKGRNNNQCVNCHSFQLGRTDNMQFHLRGDGGGTVLVADGKMGKVNLKRDGFVSAAVYPSWHPTEKLIAYSVNRTGQLFYKRDLQRVEVPDIYSDLVLYDVAHDTLLPVLCDSDALETFPSWSPDGKWLYYASAPFPQGESSREQRLVAMYDSVRYNLYRIPFNVSDLSFGTSQLVLDADSVGMSATFPRLSPDGRWLLFTMAHYGNFHIWHRSADLWITDLLTGSSRPVIELNSSDVESYHSFSSNGRWVVFSSRRDDGSYTRPYIACFNDDGTFGKPFVLPQRSPHFYEDCFYSYNIPEFTVEPVRFSAKEFAEAVGSGR